MPLLSLWPRVLVGLLVAVLLPVLAILVAGEVAGTTLQRIPTPVTAAVIVAGTLVYVGILAVVYARAIGDAVEGWQRERSEESSQEVGELGAAYRVVAASLEERDRQVATLAAETSAIPTDADPIRVLSAILGATRTITRDGTWAAAIVSTPSPDLLPVGVYGGDTMVRLREVGDLERWASTSLGDVDAGHADGPWGAFGIARFIGLDGLRGILFAPREGRAELAATDLAILTLVAQQAGTALDHSILLATARRQADELDRLARVQADFLRGVTHDLQTPLTSVAALATELRANPRLPASARTDLETITHQAERLRRMVAQLLVASRLEAGVLTPQIEVFSVPPLVERTWKALRADRPFSLVVDGAPHLAVADPDRLEQVLWAVLDNAVKYSPGGSPITVHVAPDDGSLAISVRDEGIGMSEATQRHAFDQFYRADDARKQAPDGSGVGLYAARGLLLAMGGSIEARSGLGRGTTVTVRVPAEPSASDE